MYKERKSNYENMINRSQNMGRSIGKQGEQKTTIFGGILKRSNKIGGGRE